MLNVSCFLRYAKAGSCQAHVGALQLIKTRLSNPLCRKNHELSLYLSNGRLQEGHVYDALPAIGLLNSSPLELPTMCIVNAQTGYGTW